MIIYEIARIRWGLTLGCPPGIVKAVVLLLLPTRRWRKSSVRRKLRSFLSGCPCTPLNFHYGILMLKSRRWGNTPATDVINLANNEKNEKKDFSLAFIGASTLSSKYWFHSPDSSLVASGDLRHVLSTVNGLPPTYSGRLTILLNDINPVIVCRNILLLLILGNIPDKVVAADIALHFWYSAFTPAAYRLQISQLLLNFLLQTKEGEIIVPLGPCSTLFCYLPEEASYFFQHWISDSMSIGDAQEEYDRVRNAPARGDFRDRMYARLNPSHRVAFQEYRRFGIVLPFGAANAHFNTPNLSLFSRHGKWLQTDYADPLEGWE